MDTSLHKHSCAIPLIDLEVISKILKMDMLTLSNGYLYLISICRFSIANPVVGDISLLISMMTKQIIITKGNQAIIRSM